MDELFLERQVRNFNDQILDKKRELKKRLLADEPIDASTVEILYKSLSELEAKIALYTSFKSEFYK